MAWCLARGLVLAGLILWAASPYDVALLTAFAEPNAQQYPTPTPDPNNWYVPTRNPTYAVPNNATATPTPTPYGYGQGQYPNNQYPTNQYPNNQYTGSDPTNQPNGGYPGSGGAGVQDPNNPYPYQNNGPDQSGTAPNGAASPGPGGADPCYGDELITFAPETPRVGDDLLIAVTSARPHPYGRLAGTENTHFTRERPGQRGYVWEWTITPTYPGQHEYTFYVDSTIPCQKIQLTVGDSLATKTPRPTKTPTPYGWNNNSNNNNNNGNNNNSNDNTSNGSPPFRDPNQFAFVGSDQYNCSFFYSQGEAQRVLRANPSDPNNLDSEDGVMDGIACSTYHNWQYPQDGDYNPVPRNGAPTITFGSPPYRDPNQFAFVGSDQYNCSFFYSQGEAQRVLRANPQDPNNLDTENGGARDGVACTNYSGWQYPSDVDYNPVSLNGTPTPVQTFGTPTPVGTFNPLNYVNQGDAYNCVDFNSQADAQAVLWADPNDPNKLDTAGLELNPPYAPDGIACRNRVEAPEWAASLYGADPHNYTPVPTPPGGRKSGVPAATYTPTPGQQATPTRTGTPVRGLPTSVTSNGRSGH